MCVPSPEGGRANILCQSRPRCSQIRTRIGAAGACDATEPALAVPGPASDFNEEPDLGQAKPGQLFRQPHAPADFGLIFPPHPPLVDITKLLDRVGPPAEMVHPLKHRRVRRRRGGEGGCPRGFLCAIAEVHDHLRWQLRESLERDRTCAELMQRVMSSGRNLVSDALAFLLLAPTSLRQTDALPSLEAAASPLTQTRCACSAPCPRILPEQGRRKFSVCSPMLAPRQLVGGLWRLDPRASRGALRFAAQ